jgi:K+-transporting ATPase KdpF subunit
MSRPASGWNEALGCQLFDEDSMTLDYAIGLLVTAALLVYLTFALLRPEKF